MASYCLTRQGPKGPSSEWVQREGDGPEVAEEIMEKDPTVQAVFLWSDRLSQFAGTWRRPKVAA